MAVTGEKEAEVSLKEFGKAFAKLTKLLTKIAQAQGVSPPTSSKTSGKTSGKRTRKENSQEQGSRKLKTPEGKDQEPKEPKEPKVKTPPKKKDPIETLAKMGELGALAGLAGMLGKMVPDVKAMKGGGKEIQWGTAGQGRGQNAAFESGEGTYARAQTQMLNLESDPINRLISFIQAIVEKIIDAISQLVDAIKNIKLNPFG